MKLCKYFTYIDHYLHIVSQYIQMCLLVYCNQKGLTKLTAISALKSVMTNN